MHPEIKVVNDPLFVKIIEIVLYMAKIHANKSDSRGHKLVSITIVYQQADKTGRPDQ